MPGPAKGTRPSGRQKGTPNKDKSRFRARLAELKCDPETLMCLIVNNALPCGTCRGALRTKFKLDDGLHADICGFRKVAGGKDKPCTCEGYSSRPCQSCHGSGLENCAPKLRGEMAADLLSYAEPKLKAIEVTNPDGSLQPKWVVVKPGEAK